MSRVLRWEEDVSQPGELRDAIAAARHAGPSERELEQLIANVRGVLADGGTAPAARAGRVSILRRLLVRAGIPLLVFVTAFVSTAMYRTWTRTKPAVAPLATPARFDPPPVSNVAPPEVPQLAAPMSPPLEVAVPPPVQKPRSPAAPRVRNESPAKAVLSAGSPLEEARLLRAAKQALPRASQVAAARLDEHRRNFPNGVFVEEREALEVEVLFDRGQVARAERQAAQFRERYPNSNYQRRMDDLLAGRISGSHE
ncbi:MAG TPA: hypothetical protein VFG30_08400 [Polyangiales bacterium]|nr:hypothetical protein [Polyangiales bacterium]